MNMKEEEECTAAMLWVSHSDQSLYTYAPASSETTVLHLLLGLFHLLFQCCQLLFQLIIAVRGQGFLLLLVRLVDLLLGHCVENIMESLFKSVKHCPGLELGAFLESSPLGRMDRASGILLFPLAHKTVFGDV